MATTMSEFAATPWDQPIHQVAMPLLAVKDGQTWASGTAFLIGPAMAITAWHVVEDFLLRLDGAVPPPGGSEAGFEVLTYLSLEHGARQIPLKVMRYWHSEPLDIVILGLGVPADFPDDHRWIVPKITLLPPRRGAEIIAFGFANGSVDGKVQPHPAELVDGNVQPHPAWSVQPRTSTGRVVEIHHEFRDSARAPFPCYHVNARFDGGMSGGPVIDKASGAICGMIHSSYPAISEGEEHASYVATLWPMLAVPVDRGPNTSEFPLMDLYKSGDLVADDLDRIQMRITPAGQPQIRARHPQAEWDSPSNSA